MRRIRSRLGGAVAALVLFGGGFFLGQAHGAGAARATALGPDYCVYYHDTVTLSYGAGTASVITVYAANWDSFWRRWRALYSFEEGFNLSLSCEKRYF